MATSNIRNRSFGKMACIMASPESPRGFHFSVSKASGYNGGEGGPCLSLVALPFAKPQPTNSAGERLVANHKLSGCRVRRAAIAHVLRGTPQVEYLRIFSSTVPNVGMHSRSPTDWGLRLGPPRYRTSTWSRKCQLQENKQ